MTSVAPGSPASVINAVQGEYAVRLKAIRLRYQVFIQGDPAGSSELLDQLISAEAALAAQEGVFQAALRQTPDPAAVILKVALAPTTMPQANKTLGAQTTGLEVVVHLRQAQIPTAVYNLLDPADTPLLTCSIKNVGAASSASRSTRRLRVVSYLENFSAHAVETVEVRPGGTQEIHQAPLLLPDRLAHLSELTRVALNVQIEDLDGTIEFHRSFPVWLLARTTALLAIRDPVTGEWKDMSRYFGAFVTPNVPEVRGFLSRIAERHPAKELVGYQGEQASDLVTPQVRAIYQALRETDRMQYIHSVIAFSPEDGASTFQRVRLPRESLSESQANCIDGTVLFASLLEAMTLSPALVFVPGHAFIGWETWESSGQWRFLDTTMIPRHSFEEACNTGEKIAERYRALAQKTGKKHLFRLWPLRELRSVHRIFPIE